MFIHLIIYFYNILNNSQFKKDKKYNIELDYIT